MNTAIRPTQPTVGQKVLRAIRQLRAAQEAVDALREDVRFIRRFQHLGLRRDVEGMSWALENCIVVLDSNCVAEMRPSELRHPAG